jgi:6-pyruvoyl-tetrahydropterin synthase
MPRTTFRSIKGSANNSTDAAPLAGRAPSSENIAAWLYGELKARLSGSSVELSEVEVWESPSSGVKYRP